MSSSSTITNELSDYTAQKKVLSTPLLGVLPDMDETECDYDDETFEGDEISCSISIVYKEDEQDTVNSEAFANCVIWIVLPALLYLQFGMAFCLSPVEATTGLSWSVVNYSIVLFVVTTFLFRQSARDCDLTGTAVLLLPEILMDIILGLVLFDKVVAAFLFMLVSMLVLAVFVVLSSVHVLIVTSSPTCALTYSMEQGGDELDVSMFQGGRVRLLESV
jgi:hypothetical protein